MSDRKQARELIEAAERDLSALRGMGDAGVFADEIFGFHVQQAVEKSFKAWLALLGETYPTTPQSCAFAGGVENTRTGGGSFRGFDRIYALRRPSSLRRRRTAKGAARSRRNTPARGGVAGTSAATNRRWVRERWLRNRRTCDALERNPLTGRRDTAAYTISAATVREAAEAEI